ncbi:DUF3105 domain-containing protein [Micromonospora sp. NPDC049900]|uniref:DUF3105 domain-containing protein n=1 Tax=Micromonospora sp. NPDC049900 TaxID=3364275 RepID=UPI0037A92465
MNSSSSSGRAKASGRPANRKPGGKGRTTTKTARTANTRTSGRRSRKAVVVRPGRSWASVAAFTAVGMLAVAIVGYGAFSLRDGVRPWSSRLAAVPGVVDYVSANPSWLTTEHRGGPLSYEVNPSVGGTHNSVWQNCNGVVYDAPIAAEHATHSLEHGAVWITHRPDLPAGQVARLADRVRGVDYLMLSPYDGLDAPISVQAWGYRLTVTSADDGRIDEFVRAARINAGPERGATCSGGVTTTGTAPLG